MNLRTIPVMGLAAALTVVVAGAPARAQDKSPDWSRRLALDPSSPAMHRYADQQKRRVAAEKDLKKIRHQHFGSVKSTAVRQEGIAKLREHTDPALFPSMVEIFQREGDDVKLALLDHFVDAACDEGDGAVAWLAVFDASDQVRSEAVRRISKRTSVLEKTPEPVKLVLFEGLRSQDEGAVRQSAGLINSLDLVEALPWLIAGQLGGQPQVQTAAVNTGGDRDGALAFIVVGQQTAFVSDLNPVVGPSAVAFDPQLSTITTGTIVRIVDAVVYSYRVDIHNALVDLSSRAWGRSTQGLGWNIPAWREWYRKDFLPEYTAREAARKAQREAERTGEPLPGPAKDAK